MNFESSKACIILINNKVSFKKNNDSKIATLNVDFNPNDEIAACVLLKRKGERVKLIDEFEI
jgi:hypothetical protein